MLKSAAKRIKREKQFQASLLGGELKEIGGKDLKEQLAKAAKEGLPVVVKKAK